MAKPRAPHLPATCRRPRSFRRRRPPPRGYFAEPFVCHVGSCSAVAHNIIQGSDEPVLRRKEGNPCFSLARCNLYCNNSNGVIPKPVKVPVVQVESTAEISSLIAGKNELFDEPGETGPYVNDRVGTHSFAGPLSVQFDRSVRLAKECDNSWLHPGNLVWAKTAWYEWWPAEVMDARGVLDHASNYTVNHVLVQFYGNHQFAWLDPVKDLSEFDLFYKERSNNPMKAFQGALDQALSRHAPATPELLPKISSAKLKAFQCDQSFGTSSCATPSSICDDCSEEGRGKRKRKIKIHFDDLTSPEKPVKRVRRVRIMRYLGLIAPVGSPFSPTHL